MMKLWYLGAIKPSDGPWAGTYDMAYGFVIVAESPDAARSLASGEAGEERAESWLDPSLTYCDELIPDGWARIVVRDFLAG